MSLLDSHGPRFTDVLHTILSLNIRTVRVQDDHTKNVRIVIGTAEWYITHTFIRKPLNRADQLYPVLLYIRIFFVVPS